MKKENILVIGGGIGGLATAALLGKKGYKVTLLEKNATLGGRASQWKKNGFTFDLGPSWYLMPDVFEKYFSLFGKKVTDYLKLIHLDPHYRVFFGKHDYVDIAKDLTRNLDYFETLEPGAKKQVHAYLETAKNHYDAALRYILYKNFSSFRDFFTKDIAREGRKLNVLQSLDNYIEKYVKHTRIKQILEYSVVFLGGSPKNSPAFYSILSHIDFTLGVFYPKKGIYTIIEALEKLCKENGVRIRKNTEVQELVVDNDKKIKQVNTNNGIFYADIVISNADYPFTETELLKKQHQTYSDGYWKKKTLAPSAFLLYLGIRGKVKNLKHHTLFFANDWQEHFQQIFNDPQWPEKPSYYVCCPSKTDTTVAPKGCENVFILVPVPPGLDDTDKQREAYATSIIKHLETLINESIHDRILVKRIFSQRDFISQYNAYKGTALGLAHTLQQTALFRPRIKSKKVNNLFYVGQYTQPGIGMPMCLISAELVVNEIIKQYAN